MVINAEYSLAIEKNKGKVGSPKIGMGVSIYNNHSKDIFAGTIVKMKNGNNILHIAHDRNVGDGTYERDQNLPTEVFTLRNINKKNKKAIYVKLYQNIESGDYLVIGKIIFFL